MPEHQSIIKMLSKQAQIFLSESQIAIKKYGNTKTVCSPCKKMRSFEITSKLGILVILTSNPEAATSGNLHEPWTYSHVPGVQKVCKVNQV